MLPSHAQASNLLQCGLFNDLCHFTQLEARLAKLTSMEKRTAAFSVFAEAFLATRTLPQAAEIWPEGIIPAEARRRHTLPERIPGADGIFRTLSGEIHPYQLLWQPDRHPLSRKDTALFLALADRAPQPLLFTNANHLPPPLQSHTGFHCIRGNDLDRLTRQEFNTIRRWLQGAGIVPKRVPLLPHHAKAISDLRTRWETADRVLGIMAPGTGMERLALKLAEGAGSGRTVLVLLPSLAQMRDISLLWRRHAIWATLACLWVCNETSANHDAPWVRQADLDVPLVSDSETVRRFLAWRFHGVRVLFTTYSSVRITARALIGFSPLDLGIFLKSHETTADPFALDNTNLPIRKRLFLSTATRHASPLIKPTTKKQKDNSDQGKKQKLIWNLEDPTRYGSVIPIAPLTQAVAHNILRPWKLLLVVIPSDAVSAPTEEEEKSMACGYALRLVLNHPIHGRHRQHIHLYHHTTQEAQALTHMPPINGKKLSPFWGFDNLHTDKHPKLTEYTLHHLEGASRASDRDQVLSQYAQSKQAILNNVRCLAESLTPPLAEMLLFLSAPKKGKVEISHALAAILAKQEAKLSGSPHQEQNMPPETERKETTTHGLICIPIFLSDTTESGSIGASIKDGLSTTSTLWEVLQVLRELDPSLEKQILQAGEAYGRTGRWPDRTDETDRSALAERFDILLPDRLPPIWAEQIWTACLEQLTTVWDQRFGQLQRYDWDEIPQLNAWVDQQRRAYAKGKLSQDRIQRLEKFGFVWDLKKADWDTHFAAFEQYQRHQKEIYHEKNGLRPPLTPEEPTIARWVQQQRNDRKKGRMDPEWVAQLDRIGFIWDPESVTWEAMFAELQTFTENQQAANENAQEQGTAPLTCLVPEKWPENPALATWAKQQRQAFAKNTLTPEQIDRLNTLGFVWDLKDAHWETQFSAFLSFKQTQGHGKVPEVWPEDPELAAWARTQRKEWSRNKRPSERFTRLEDQGFCWDLDMAYWEEMAMLLEDFHAEHGHSIVPPSWPTNPLLADWTNRQRRDFRTGRLGEAQVARLDALGFVWDLEEKAWNDMFDALSRFHTTHGHCHVPDPHLLAQPSQEVDEDNAALAEWIRRQRRAGLSQPEQNTRTKRRNTLSIEQRQRLDSLAFIWDPKEAEWEAMFLALENFRKERNHCLVPSKFPKDTRHKPGGPLLIQLAQWVTTLRREYANDTLSAEKIQRLNALNFIWDAKAVLWEEMFAALATFRDQYGNCLVPETYEENPQLAWWVVTQRKAYRSGQLEAERISRLNDLGFFWDPLEAQWYEMFQELVRYQAQFGHCLIARDWTGHPKLAPWVVAQRQARQHGNLSQPRTERLDALGFVWDQKEVILEEMLAELATFKQSHGHCNVPIRWAKNPELGLWVQFQRQEYKKNKLDPNRIQRLEALGFSWT